MSITMFISCTNDSADNEAVNEEVAAELRALGFNTDDLIATTMRGEEGYLVERDIFLTDEDIANLAPRRSVDNGNEVNTEHYRTNNIVSTPRVLNIYFDDGFTRSDVQAAFDEALDRFNALNLDLTFQRANAPGADIDILAERLGRVRGNIILGQSAGFPDAAGNPATPIILNSAVYNPRRGGVPADVVTVIAHEIGHAIGFRHTDFFDRSFSCGQGGDEGDAGVGAIFIPGTPAGPENGSWMLACSSGTDRPFTSGDQTALTTVY
ncbi:protease B [Leptobacterium flavescens]|uniref:Protease B n=2 Tax=Leptobacterium flavescens TaxID=472055 RepID=A0A6P0UIF6_9FLAO|nr:protease B [Leptobacterium flavescens]